MLRSLRAVPKCAGDQAAHVEGRRQQGVHDGELVVGLVLGVGVDDHASSAGRFHRLPSFVRFIRY